MTKQEQINQLEKENFSLIGRINCLNFELETALEAIRQRDSGKGAMINGWNKEKYSYDEYVAKLINAYIFYLHATGNFNQEYQNTEDLEESIKELMNEDKEIYKGTEFFARKLKGVNQNI